MNEDFIFRLGADVSSFTKSITEVEAELKSARQAIKGALGDDLVKGNTYVEALEQSLKDLKATGVQIPGSKEAANGLKNIAPAAQKAQNTLTGLSGVVRDLPFGFVAIQNNLPILADSFGNLTKTSGGFKAGLKDLGAALAGPAGVSFAIGAVISGITVLVQKYGSLSAALTEVLNLSKSQRDLTLALDTATAKNIGSAEAEITVLRTLAGVLTDTNSSLDAKNGAYAELNKQYPGLLSNLNEEKVKSGQLNNELAARLLLFTKQIQLNGQRAALEKLIGEEAEKSFKSIAQFKNQDFFDGLLNELTGVFKGFNSGTAGLQDFSKGLSNSAKSTKFYESTLKGVQTQLSGIDGQILAIVEASKKKTKAVTDTADSTNKLATANNALSSSLTGAEATVKANTFFFQKWNEAIGETKRTLGQALALVPKQLPTTAPAVNPNQANIAQQSKEASDALKTLNRDANLESAFNLANETFFSPLQNLFSDLISGAEGAFKAFAKAVLQAINQIVAKIIATGIIQLLITLASGGFSSAAGGFAGGMKTVLKGIGKSLGFGGIANPNFSGVGAGALNMAGAVNVVLRGQDLVGSLNRTNAQISRVG